VRKAVIAAAALSLAAFAAQAQTLADVKKRGSLRIGYSETSVPFSFRNNEGQPSGYSVELCQRVAAAGRLHHGAGRGWRGGRLGLGRLHRGRLDLPLHPGVRQSG
jgi:hypothetical protein